MFLAGNLYTTWTELDKAKYRKERGYEQVEAVLHYKELGDEELGSIIEYTRGADEITERPSDIGRKQSKRIPSSGRHGGICEMKVVILAGGFGTRISEESHLKPKPMIEIGERPILWHIMKYYSQFGFHEFVICLGYKQYVVKEFFADYFLHTSDVTFDLANNQMEVHNNYSEPWKVTLVDTGLHTMTGGRIKRIRDYVGGETFMLTYGDGVADVDLSPRCRRSTKATGRSPRSPRLTWGRSSASWMWTGTIISTPSARRTTTTEAS